MWLHLDILVPKRLSLFWRYEGNVQVCSSKNDGKSFTATKGGGQAAYGKPSISLRYQVCCSLVLLQRSVAAVLKSVVFCSE